MPHTTAQIAIRAVYQQMVMVGHQAKGRDLEIPHLCGLLQNSQKHLIVLAGPEDLFSAPPTVHDMIPGTWILYA